MALKVGFLLTAPDMFIQFPLPRQQRSVSPPSPIHPSIHFAAMDSMAFPTTPGATFSQQIRPKGISIVVTAPTPATPDFHTRQLQQKGSSPPPTIPTACK